MNAYAVLGLQPGCSQDEIKAKYRSLARQFHPDKLRSSENTTNSFLQINEAYNKLKSTDDLKLYAVNAQRQKIANATEVDLFEFEPMDEDGVCVFAYLCRCGDAILVPAEDLDDHTVYECEGCSLGVVVRLPTTKRL